MTISQALEHLQSSNFRSRFHLSKEERNYISSKGLEVIREHGRDFIRTRLAPAQIPNDGRQTPMRGHPIFVAQHACACCCRGCLQKWYHIPRGRPLTQAEQEGILALLMAWIRRDLQRNP